MSTIVRISRHIKKVEDAMKMTNSKEAYIVTKDDFRVIRSRTGRIVLIPALVFCLFVDEFI